LDLQLTNHVAVVVGGASGIGLAAAKLFAAEGAKVAVWDQVPTPDAFCVSLDVVDEAAVREAMSKTLAQFGRVDHLVHAAAIGSGKFGFPFTNLTPADWPLVLQVNIMGMTNVAHAVAPHLIERKSGTMIFLASVAGQIGSQTDPPYSASKAANINFAQCLAKDLAPHGVRVNTICPGMVRTPLNRSVWQAWHNAATPEDRLSYEDWSAKKIKAVVPLGTWQMPEDIADMIVFLSSARAGQVTGQTINVDGGFVMHW
jgi:2-hydroxycyclohexanecarboxyl-CoA dehydrogenase